MSLSKTEIKSRLWDLRNKTKLHVAALKHVSFLEEKIKELKNKLFKTEQERNEWEERAKEAEKQLKDTQDINKKLKSMLFEKYHGKIRTKRPKKHTQRTAESYRRPMPEVITDRKELSIDACSRCDTPVADPVSFYTRITEDIVFNPQPNVIEWTIHRYWCSSCQKQVSGHIPGILPKTRIGPNTLTFIVIAKYRWNQPYEKIRDQLAISFGLHISQGEIADLITRAASLAGQRWEEITQAVKSGHTVHCDETGWYINGKKVWVHTFATESVILYAISPSRGKGVAENHLNGYEGVRVTDCLPNYKNMPGSHQICWAHITREAQENNQRMPDNTERMVLSKELDTIYDHIRKVTGQEVWDQQYADRIHGKCQKQLNNLHQQQWFDPQCQRILNRLQDFKHALFTCLSAPGIPPDNNHAERVLRKIVVQRKISGGNRSPTHAQHHAKLMTVMETLRLEDKPFLSNLQDVFGRAIDARLSGG